LAAAPLPVPELPPANPFHLKGHGGQIIMACESRLYKAITLTLKSKKFIVVRINLLT
jgi:hypothetical protein